MSSNKKNEGKETQYPLESAILNFDNSTILTFLLCSLSNLSNASKTVKIGLETNKCQTKKNNVLVLPRF